MARLLIYFLLPFIPAVAQAQAARPTASGSYATSSPAVAARPSPDTAFHPIPVRQGIFGPQSIIATLSLGFANSYRNNYSLPPGYLKHNTSGFVPVTAKFEYGVSPTLGIAANLGYDRFQYNYGQLYYGNNGAFTRYRNDNTRIFSAGVIAYYHLRRWIHIRHLDPFVGLGAALNNIRYGAHPAADTLNVKIDHTATPYLKAGARYYVTHAASLFADLGYDHHTAFSIGFSYRFNKTRYYPDADRDGIPDQADSCIDVRGGL